MARALPAVTLTLFVSLALFACGDPKEKDEHASLEQLEHALDAFHLRCTSESDAFFAEAEPILFGVDSSPHETEGTLQSLVDAGNLEVDADRIPGCVAALEDASCDAPSLAPCEKVFAGACAIRLGCAGDGCARGARERKFDAGDACDAEEGGCGDTAALACVEGRCTAVSVVGEGATCSLEDNSTRYCRNQSTSHACVDGVCVKRPGRGEACLLDALCDTTQALCDDEGTCVAGGAEGEACVVDECQVGLLCVNETCVGVADAGRQEDDCR